MSFFYSAAVMGYGKGRIWHRYLNLPIWPRVTKTLTLKPKIGCPFAVIKIGKTIWNKVGLHNCGFHKWLKNYSNIDKSKIIVSIAGYDNEIEEMTHKLDSYAIGGIELNFSCPNVKSFENKIIPSSNHKIYLKLNHKQDPYEYDLDRIEGIRLNSIPTLFGGLSGKYAQKYNWPMIKKWNYEGLNAAGSSTTTYKDYLYLKEFCGCKEIGIGSLVLTNVNLIQELGK